MHMCGVSGLGGIWRESARWDEKYVVGGQLARGIWREYAGCHSRQLHIVGVYRRRRRRKVTRSRLHKETRCRRHKERNKCYFNVFCRFLKMCDDLLLYLFLIYFILYIYIYNIGRRTTV